jgi:hydrogenase nickel incorporation protein HypA/HybF
LHEQPIAEAILSRVLEKAEEAKANRILRVYLVVGELSGASDYAIEFYWGFLTKNTIAAQSELSFSCPKGKVRCRNCGTIFTVERLNFTCPNCKENKIEIISGDELYITSVEVE